MRCDGAISRLKLQALPGLLDGLVQRARPTGPDNMTIVARMISHGAASGIAYGAGPVAGILIFLTSLRSACRSLPPKWDSDDDPALCGRGGGSLAQFSRRRCVRLDCTEKRCPRLAPILSNRLASASLRCSGVCL